MMHGQKKKNIRCFCHCGGGFVVLVVVVVVVAAAFVTVAFVVYVVVVVVVISRVRTIAQRKFYHNTCLSL
jgi:hypothetical protein